MRLNANIRGQIVNGAMAKLYKAGTALIETGGELAYECYCVALSVEERKAAALLATVQGEQWVATPGNRVSFNVAGQYVTFEYHLKHQKAHPLYVPRQYYNGSRLGKPILLDKNTKLVERVRDWQDAMIKHAALEGTTRKSLEVLVKGVGTTDSLFKAWPEGKQFYSSPPLPDNPVKLPAVQMEALNKALGLAA